MKRPDSEEIRAGLKMIEEYADNNDLVPIPEDYDNGWYVRGFHRGGYYVAFAFNEKRWVIQVTDKKRSLDSIKEHYYNEKYFSHAEFLSLNLDSEVVEVQLGLIRNIQHEKFTKAGNKPRTWAEMNELRKSQ